MKLRDELKAGNLSVRNSKRFARLDDFFIDGGRWQAMREDFFHRSGLPSDPKQAAEYLARRLGDAYDSFLKTAPTKMMAENLAEEEGFKALPQPGHQPHDHVELILRFCRAAGLTDQEVRNMKMPPAWWARSLYYYYTVATEPVGVVLAMQSTQEGQMPGLIGEVLLPAFEKHYGLKRSAREIEFFTEHDSADVEHSRRQSDLCAKYLDAPDLQARALRVAQEICELRWASISELYRSEVVGEKEILPPGVES